MTDDNKSFIKDENGKITQMRPISLDTLSEILDRTKNKRTEFLSQNKSENSKEISSTIIERYGKKSLSELFQESGRAKSMLIYKMMANSGMQFSEMAYYLMCTPLSLRNKLSRGAFSFDELLSAATACGYEWILRKKDGSEQEVIDANSYFGYSKDEKDIEYWAQLLVQIKEENSRKKKELAQLKERIEQLNSEINERQNAWKEEIEQLMKENEDLKADILDNTAPEK